MVTCSGCGRVIERVPDWLTGVKVEFVCNNCPNRQTKNIAFVNFETEAKPEVDDEVGAEELGEDDLEA